MMEESSDESAELVDKEEAVSAEKQFTDQQQNEKQATQQPGVASSIAPPAPLPSFLTQSLSQQQTPPQVGVAQLPVTPQKPQTVAPPTQAPASTSPGVQAPPTSSQVFTPPPSSQVLTPPSSSQVLTPLQQQQAPPTVSPQQIIPPGPQESPIQVSQAIDVAEMEIAPPSPQSPGAGGQGGLFGWFSGNKMISKVMEKTKSSVETMITTLDPGMKEIIKSGGDICILATSTKESKVGAVREAFQQTFGRATVIGKESQATTAAQPVGFTAGLKGAQERIQNLRQTADIPDDQPIVSIEGFIVELLPDRWYELSCLTLQDPEHRIDLQTFSQPSPIPAEYILKAQDRTPKDYPLRWSGLAVTIGQIVEEENPHIGHVDWQNGIVGVSRRESLFLAAKSLAYMYKQRLPTAFVS